MAIISLFVLPITPPQSRLPGAVLPGWHRLHLGSWHLGGWLEGGRSLGDGTGGFCSWKWPYVGWLMYDDVCCMLYIYILWYTYLIMFVYIYIYTDFQISTWWSEHQSFCTYTIMGPTIVDIATKRYAQNCSEMEGRLAAMDFSTPTRWVAER